MLGSKQHFSNVCAAVCLHQPSLHTSAEMCLFRENFQAILSVDKFESELTFPQCFSSCGICSLFFVMFLYTVFVAIVVYTSAFVQMRENVPFSLVWTVTQRALQIYFLYISKKRYIWTETTHLTSTLIPVATAIYTNILFNGIQCKACVPTSTYIRELSSHWQLPYSQSPYRNKTQCPTPSLIYT